MVSAAFLVSVPAWSQAYTPPPPPLTTAPCVPTKKDPCTAPGATKAPAIPATADKFPFPGETPGAVPDIPADAPRPTPDEDKQDRQDKNAPPADPARPSSAVPKPPAASAPNAQPAAGGQFPFPGEAADSSSSSSSSSSGESSSSSSSSSVPDDATGGAGAPPLKDEGSTGSTRFQRKHLAKVEDTDARELKDIEVSHFYLTTGNFPAAYTRAQDAVKLYPDDENAHLALAEAADKLKKRDEAADEYKVYLKLAPDGDKAKQAERALAALPPR